MTWARLQEEFAQWAKRPRTATEIASYVSLAETRFNRRLRVRQMEKAVSGTTTGNALVLPSDHVATKALWVPGFEAVPLKPQTLDFVIAQKRLSGPPTAFAVGASVWTFDGSGDVQGVYFGAIPGLVASGSNWLSVAAFDAYLFGVLAEAATDERDLNQSALWMARCDAALSDLTNNDQRDRFTGPLISRKR